MTQQAAGGDGARSGEGQDLDALVHELREEVLRQRTRAEAAEREVGRLRAESAAAADRARPAAAAPATPAGQARRVVRALRRRVGGVVRRVRR